MGPVTELVVADLEVGIFSVDLRQLSMFVSKDLESKLVFFLSSIVQAILVHMVEEHLFDVAWNTLRISLSVLSSATDSRTDQNRES